MGGGALTPIPFATPTQAKSTPRGPGSAWRQKNIAHAEKLITEGRMTPAGLAQVQAARQNGRWDTACSGGKNASTSISAPCGMFFRQWRQGLPAPSGILRQGP